MAFEAGMTIGEVGSEGGEIVADEEYSGGARITLERGGHHPFSITCGVYGWLVHTRFFDLLDEAEREFAAMKNSLKGISDLVPHESETDLEAKCARVPAACESFVAEFR